MRERHAVIDELSDGEFEDLSCRVPDLWAKRHDTHRIAALVGRPEHVIAAVLAFSRDCMFEFTQEEKANEPSNGNAGEDSPGAHG